MFQKFSDREKFLWRRRRGKYEDFLSKKFCFTVPQKFVLEPFRVSLISGIEIFYASDGYITIFRRKFIVSQNRKTLQGNLSVLRFGKFPVSHKFMDEKRGSIKFFRPFFLSHSVGKYRRGLFIVSLTSGMEKNRMSELAVGGESQDIPSKFLLSQSAENFRNSSLLSFRNFLIAKKFIGKREGEVSRFSFEKILSHSAGKKS